MCELADISGASMGFAGDESERQDQDQAADREQSHDSRVTAVLDLFRGRNFRRSSGVGYGLDCGPQAALCSGGMVASASGEQLGLSSGMTWLLIVPTLPGPGILCVPNIVMSLVGG